MTRFDRNRQIWENLGQKDAMWGVLSHESKKDNKWNPKEFFQDGQNQLESILAIFNVSG